MFLDGGNKTKLAPAFLFIEFLWKKYLKKYYRYTRHNLCSATKLNCLVYIALTKICWKLRLGEFKSQQKYFTKKIKKSWKPYKITVTVQALQLIYIWETFIYENNCIIPTNLGTNCLLSLLSFWKKQKKVSNFHQVSGLVTKNVFYSESPSSLKYAEFNRTLYKNFL